MFNNVDVVGRVNKVYRLKFDYYSKLEATVTLDVIEGNQILKCICRGDFCQYILKYIHVNDTVFLNGRLENSKINGNNIIIYSICKL